MSVESIIDATADCVLPDEVMFSIFTRLPVKSLARFRSVCTQWREIFATPRFKKLHYNQSYRAFLVFKDFPAESQEMYLFTLESDNEPSKLDLPYHVPIEWRPSSVMYFVGCINGLVCMAVFVRQGELGIKLWNPALRLSKFVPIPDADLFYVDIALGFGYDAGRDDYRVVSIFTSPRNNASGLEASVYSAESDTWISVELPSQIREFYNGNFTYNSAIVDGNPYWFARIDENDQRLTDVLVWCDVTRLEFKIVPLAGLNLEEPAKVPFVNWKGSLATFLYAKIDERIESLDVWVFDDSEMVWRKNHTFGPIEIKMDRCLQCSENGIIVGDCLDGKLSVLDPETRWFKEIEIGEYQNDSLQINGYIESLVCIEGMTEEESNK